jgi:hypothetical protein
MSHSKRLTRREFIKLSSATSLGVALSACGVAPTPTATPAPTNTPLPTNTPASTVTPLPTSTSSPTATLKPPTLADLARKVGFDVGISFTYNPPAELHNAELLLNFSILQASSVFGPYWKDLRVRDTYIKALSKFAQDHEQRLHLGHLYWPGGDFNKDSLWYYLLNAPNDIVTSWMADRAKTIFEVPYFTDLNFVNEVIWGNDERPNFGWQTYPNPYYRVYGEDWIYEAYKVAWNAALKAGKKIGRDIRLTYNTTTIETFAPVVEYEFQHLTRLKSRISQELGIERPFDIGLQFHTRTVPLNQVICWGVHSKNIEKRKLIEHFRRFGQIGDIRITEFSIGGTDDQQKQKDILHIIVESAIESGVCKSFIMWEPLKVYDTNPDSQRWNSCRINNLLDQSYKPLFLFDELYKILQTYAQTKRS